MKKAGGPRTARLFLALFAALTGVWLAFLLPRFHRDTPYIVAPLMGLCGVGTIFAIRSYLDQDEEEAFDRALKGLPPEDGRWFVAIGEIHPVDRHSLTAPFSGTSAVAYEYLVSRFARQVPGPVLRPTKELRQITAYSGHAAVPCEVRTPTGPVRLVEWPYLQGERIKRDASEDYERARAFIGETPFTDVWSPEYRGKDGNEPARTPPAGFLTREDLRANPGADLTGWTLDEVVVRTGENVCVFGLYSATRGGLVRPPTVSRLSFRLAPGGAKKTETAVRNRGCLATVATLLLLAQIIVVWRAMAGS